MPGRVRSAGHRSRSWWLTSLAALLCRSRHVSYELAFYDITPVRRLSTPDELERPDRMVWGIGALGRAWRQWRPTGLKLCCW